MSTPPTLLVAYGILYVLMLTASGDKRLCVGLVSVRCLSVCLSRRSIESGQYLPALFFDVRHAVEP